MMTLQGFINKWNGKPLSVLSPGRQCFDVAAAWCSGLEIPNYPGNPSPFPYQYAYQIYTNFSDFQSKYFDRVANGLFNAPQAGDIVVWKPGYNGGAGHVGIATGKNTLFTFEVFEQNDPVGYPCQLRTYRYDYMQTNGIYGWLHPHALDKLTPEQFRQLVNDKVETQITDTAFRNYVRDLLKR